MTGNGRPGPGGRPGVLRLPLLSSVVCVFDVCCITGPLPLWRSLGPRMLSAGTERCGHRQEVGHTAALPSGPHCQALRQPIQKGLSAASVSHAPRVSSARPCATCRRGSRPLPPLLTSPMRCTGTPPPPCSRDCLSCQVPQISKMRPFAEALFVLSLSHRPALCRPHTQVRAWAVTPTVLCWSCRGPEEDGPPPSPPAPSSLPKAPRRAPSDVCTDTLRRNCDLRFSKFGHAVALQPPSEAMGVAVRRGGGPLSPPTLLLRFKALLSLYSQSAEKGLLTFFSGTKNCSSVPSPTTPESVPKPPELCVLIGSIANQLLFPTLWVHLRRRGETSSPLPPLSAQASSWGAKGRVNHTIVCDQVAGV